MVKIDLDVFKKAWYKFDEIEQIKESSEEINNWWWQTLEDAFSDIKKTLFSKKENKWVKL